MKLKPVIEIITVIVLAFSLFFFTESRYALSGDVKDGLGKIDRVLTVILINQLTQEKREIRKTPTEKLTPSEQRRLEDIDFEIELHKQRLRQLPSHS